MSNIQTYYHLKLTSIGLLILAIRRSHDHDRLICKMGITVSRYRGGTVSYNLGVIIGIPISGKIIFILKRGHTIAPLWLPHILYRHIGKATPSEVPGTGVDTDRQRMNPYIANPWCSVTAVHYEVNPPGISGPWSSLKATDIPSTCTLITRRLSLIMDHSTRSNFPTGTNRLAHQVYPIICNTMEYID